MNSEQDIVGQGATSSVEKQIEEVTKSMEKSSISSSTDSIQESVDDLIDNNGLPPVTASAAASASSQVLDMKTSEDLENHPDTTLMYAWERFPSCPLMEFLSPEWQDFLDPETVHSCLKNIWDAMLIKKPMCVSPRPRDIFNAYNKCPPGKVRVVIVGNDPAPQAGSSHGIAFSAPDSSPENSSIRIMNEALLKYGHITKMNRKKQSKLGWCEQGVLLINAHLTINLLPKDKYHRKIGWDNFTKLVVTMLCEDAIRNGRKLVLLQLGQEAQKIDPDLSAFEECIQNHVKFIKTDHPTKPLYSLEYTPENHALDELISFMYHPEGHQEIKAIVKDSDFIANDWFGQANEFLEDPKIDWNKME